MAANNMSPYSVGLKRKEPDDELLQDLLNVSLSSPKKLRSSDERVTSSPGAGSVFGNPLATEVSAGNYPKILARPEAVSSGSTLSPLHLGEEQKALVLYRPVTPPLFPGGPPAGSVDFPYKVNMSMLPIPQALDLSGSPLPLLPGQRRLTRVSSCSSLPRSVAEDQVMVEEVDKSAELAVIPWVPMTPIVAPKIRSIIEEVDDEPDVDEMMEESMEVVNEDPISISEISTTPMPGQFGSPVISFSAGPWQAEMHQPSFTTAMWSA